MSGSAIVIAGAARTPIGVLGGALSSVPAHELGAVAIAESLARAGVSPAEVDEAILGQVLTAGAGQNPARQAAMAAGMPAEKTAFVINQLCGSGLRAVALGMQQILAGDAEIVVAGGQESMSLSPHCAYLRSATRMGDAAMVDTMLKDGLVDAFYGYHMGVTAENIAERWGLPRAVQDDYAARSQNRAEAARAAGRFADEIVPVTVAGRKSEVVVDQDEGIREGMTAQALERLRPAFMDGGSVTAGNASGINDGAAALVLMDAANAERRGIEPLARIVSWATAGVDPQVMGTGPIPASKKALAKAGWQIGDLDLIEANEAFAAQACVVARELALDPEKVNVNGGAIALGHPIGASGARVLTTLLYEMRRRGAKKGLATLCIGGGMGVAMCVERA
ncbi:acetyl-CoA C-acetyltransferase [Martelella mediterranea]|uniref:acetyl-CoA C-acetyltransferase n=1 Tax=Martelella mediterranea TaxID=293089 RepID=UPI001E485C8E|nr:acetyl-CoA C-acetyltransferase [Martelella mediterranea]MCD1634094.1 acetyl-CoA C-acetyltransferase [Martelella mediterranea]